MTVRDHPGTALPDVRQHDSGHRANRANASLMLRCAADIIPKPVEWLWPGRIAVGKLTLIAGEAGLGKSQILSGIAASVTTGGPWPCGEGGAPLGSIVILSAEDSTADTMVPRLMAAGADLKRVQFVTAVRDRRSNGYRAFNLQSDLELLDREIRRLGDVRLVGVDPISSYLGPKIDSHANAAVRSVLEPLGEMAERLRVAVVAITHPPKGTGTTAINRFIGSIAFVAAARAAYMVTRDPGDDTRRLFLPVKNNLAPLGKGLAFRLKERIVGGPDSVTAASAIVWDVSRLDISANQALLAADSGGDNREKPASTEAEEFLKCVLGNGAVPSNEIRNEARAAGVSWPTVRRAKDRLAIEARKTGMDCGWVWALPKTPNSSEDAHPPKLSTFEPDEHLRANANGKPAPANDSWPDLPPCLDRRIPRPR
jgi:putative DNA primase/helicase